jgi:hypothetical protein
MRNVLLGSLKILKPMFMQSQKVICVDDTNPNPLCGFPCGYVVRGCIYFVKGVTVTGGVQIEGLPVIGYFRFAYALLKKLPLDGDYEDVGWKPHRFRKYDDQSSDEEVSDSLDLELVGAGSGR